jgi:hypothetical protein
MTVLLATLIAVSTSAPAWAAQLDATINPNDELSPFKMTYQKTVFIEYPNGGNLSDELQGKEWRVSGTADSTNPGVQSLIGELNRGIVNDGSQAQIADLNVSYDFHLQARDTNTSIDYNVVLEGVLSDYVITQDSQGTLVDLGWRGLSTDNEIVIDDVEINIPINILRDQEPEVYAYFVGTEAEDVLGRHLIDADFILKQPLTNWHFLFDPTGINVDAGTYGLDDDIAGFVLSKWTMGERSIREGIQPERFFEAEVVSDQTYAVRSIQSDDQATLTAVGFGALDMLDGIEIIGLTPTPPEGFMTTSTGDFPVLIIYGMAGIAAVAGIAFFFISSRSLKNTSQGQQGIDPTRLVGYETSDSSGGYKTNRGEAQLKDDSDYQQTRSHYDTTQSPPPPPQTTPSAREEAACGCAASAEMGSECDCAMQGACLCDGTCQCNADICKEQVSSMR